MLRIHSRSKCFFLFLLCISISFVSAQHSINTDSLIASLSSQKQDTNLVKKFVSLVKDLRSSSPTKAIQVGSKGVSLARKLEFFRGECELFNVIASVYNQVSKPDSAEIFLTKSLSLAQRYSLLSPEVKALKDLADLCRTTGKFEKSLSFYEQLEPKAIAAGNTEAYAASFSGRGVIYHSKNDPVNTLRNIQKAVAILDTVRPKREYAVALMGIALIYHDMKQTEKAAETFKKVLTIYRAVNADFNATGDYYGLASNYLNMGSIFNDLFESDSSLVYFKKAIELGKKYNLKKVLALAYYTLGDTYFNKNDIKQSEQSYLSALDLYESMNYKLGKAYVLNNLCNMYEKTNNFNKVEPYLLEAINISEMLGDSLKMKEFYLKAAVLYARKQDFKKAYNYRVMHEVLNNRMFNAQNSRMMNEMLAKYESDAKEKENRSLQKENELSQQIIQQQKTQNYLFIAGAFLLILLGFFIFRGLKLQRDNFSLTVKEQGAQLIRMKEMKTLAELKTLQARINPHFLYNSLNSITELIYEKPEQAEEMIIKLSKLFRYSINTQEANWSTVKEELSIVQTYLDIERVRFGNRIHFEIHSDDAVMNNMIPRFLIQPLVENALKHGLKNKFSDGNLVVNVVDKKEKIQINVHDNGIPFPQDMLAGYGMQSVNDKLSLLCGSNWKVSYVNSENKRVSIEIPKYLNV